MGLFIGIDYGRKWCGLARSEGELADPLMAVPTGKVVETVKKLQPDLVVVGVSESLMARESLGFAKKLAKMLSLPVTTVDETLTSFEAEEISRDKKKQHAIAAALILQRYLDGKDV